MNGTRILISGSVAFDTIMVFEGLFREHILPERVHQLNVSFLVPQMKREPGGCAANIAYNLRLLGGHPAILSAVGADGVEYRARLAAMGVDVTQLLVRAERFTPQCFITTDLSANQFAAFHPGAMDDAHLADPGALAPAAWGIISPSGKQAMTGHAERMAELQIPYVLDPGQGLPLFNGDELKAMVHEADALTVNDYEFGLMLDKTGWSEQELIRAAGTALVTLGADGADLYENGAAPVRIRPTAARQVVDPTGCGDALRGGLLYGLASGWDWLKSARLGSVLGAIKIESHGPQNHTPSRDDIAARFEQTFGDRPW